MIAAKVYNFSTTATIVVWSVSVDRDDAVRHQDLHHQLSIMGCGYKLIQSWPTNDDIEQKFDACYIEDNVLHPEVICHPEGDKQSEVAVWPDKILAYPTERARWCHLGHEDLQRLEGMQTHDAESDTAVNQHVMHPNNGNGR
jgi:hypothetical protein